VHARLCPRICLTGQELEEAIQLSSLLVGHKEQVPLAGKLLKLKGFFQPTLCP